MFRIFFIIFLCQFGLQQPLEPIDEAKRYQIAGHEIVHAIVNLMLLHGFPIRYVIITPNGENGSYGCNKLIWPSKYTTKQLKAAIEILMAAGAYDYDVFRNANGSGMDIELARHYSYTIVVKKIFKVKKIHLFNYPNDSNAEVKRQVEKNLDDAICRAREKFTQTILDEIARGRDLLLESNYMSGEELYRNFGYLLPSPRRHRREIEIEEFISEKSSNVDCVPFGSTKKSDSECDSRGSKAESILSMPKNAESVVRAFSPDRPRTWTGEGFVRVRENTNLTFVVEGLTKTGHYNLVVRFELAPDDPIGWEDLKINIVRPRDPSSVICANAMSSDDFISARLPPWSRFYEIHHAVCLEYGIRYEIRLYFGPCRFNCACPADCQSSNSKK